MKILFKSFFGGIIFYLLFGGVFWLMNNEMAMSVIQSDYIYAPLILFIVATVAFGYFKLRKMADERADKIVFLANESGNVDGVNKEVGYDSKAN